MIAVSDSGAGISAANLEKVFDPFFTTKEVGKGTGQGLSMAYSSIVQKHGGKVWAHSVLGQGATFGFSLPGAHVT